MSLVSEALRKARQHQGSSAERGRGAVVPPTLALPPRQRRSGVGVAPLLLVAVVAGLAGAAGIWWVAGLRSGEPSPQASGIVAPSATAAANAEATKAAQAVPTPATSEAPAEPKPAATGAVAPATPPVPEPAPAASAPGAATVPVLSGEPRPSQPTAENPVSDAGPRDKTFLIDADLGYAKLHLDYLVFRAGSPFGRVNGQDVVIGSTVEGFLVEEITADYIKLADKRHVVTLRVR